MHRERKAIPGTIRRSLYRSDMPCSSTTHGDFRGLKGFIRALFTFGVKIKIRALNGPGKSEFAPLFCEFVTFSGNLNNPFIRDPVQIVLYRPRLAKGARFIKPGKTAQ